MLDENTFKKKLIDYIKVNDNNFSRENLKTCSLTTLTIIKTAIEVKQYYKQKKN